MLSGWQVKSQRETVSSLSLLATTFSLLFKSKCRPVYLQCTYTTRTAVMLSTVVSSREPSTCRVLYVRLSFNKSCDRTPAIVLPAHSIKQRVTNQESQQTEQEGLVHFWSFDESRRTWPIEALESAGPLSIQYFFGLFLVHPQSAPRTTR